MMPGGFKSRKAENKQKNPQNIFTQTFGSFDRKLFSKFKAHTSYVNT